MNKRSSFYKRDSHVQMFMFNVIMSEEKSSPCSPWTSYSYIFVSKVEIIGKK